MKYSEKSNGNFFIPYSLISACNYWGGHGDALEMLKFKSPRLNKVATPRLANPYFYILYL